MRRCSRRRSEVAAAGQWAAPAAADRTRRLRYRQLLLLLLAGARWVIALTLPESFVSLERERESRRRWTHECRRLSFRVLYIYIYKHGHAYIYERSTHLAEKFNGTPCGCGRSSRASATEWGRPLKFMKMEFNARARIVIQRDHTPVAPFAKMYTHIDIYTCKCRLWLYMYIRVQARGRGGCIIHGFLREKWGG